ncbi:chemotaxis protein CheA [Candidatus Woesearchaeota archaeon]|nr:MAG: chemotaxis protein CheA [Candidatus Woesearchaeota archaeon]
MEEYKEIFVNEAKEHLDNLNNGLVSLEKNPKDSEIINNIFRSFHTLKGNSATMGYEKFSNLAHKLEDLLDLIRNNKLSINSDIMDVLLMGCDYLDDGLSKIEGDISESIDARKVYDKLNKINPEEKKIEEIEYEVPNKLNLTKSEEKKIKDLKGYKLDDAKRVVIEFEDHPLKNIKALAILKKLDELSKIIRQNLSKKDIQNKKLGIYLDMIILVKEPEKVKEILSQMTKIKSHNLLELNDDFASHMIESKKSDIMVQHKEEMDKIQEVRIDIKRLDSLMDMVGELLIYNMRLETINKDLNSKNLEEIMNSINLLTQNIQNEVIEERMIPLKSVFNRFPRIVRDLSKEEGKEIEFVIEGEENKLDRTVIDKITDPLIHIIRNSVDHGIEIPTEREKNGKPSKGLLKLSAKREKNHVCIEVMDDGSGIDPEVIKKKALEKGIIDAVKLGNMDETKIQEMIFLPGFSTNETITEISGRGVGMDVVQTNIRQAKGKVFLESKKDEGTKIRIELPLTMAIITVLIVGIADEKYSIPLNNVFRVMNIKRESIKTIENQESFVLRNETLPLLRLKNLLGLEEKEKDEETIVIVESGTQKICLVVDDIMEQEQILIKNIDDTIKKVKGISGATILGDGNVCFILDIDSLIGE